MEENQSLLELQVDKQASDNLVETSRWAKLLAVIGLICIGVLFLVLVLLRNKIAEQFLSLEELKGSESSIFIISLVVGFLIVALVFGMLLNFLLKGANRIRQGILHNDQTLFNSGLSSLKNYFIMYGVLGILGLLFSLLAFINS
ncbi:hypothetical protein [Terrimonas alba]|uniref:hypothetical protein n=1 Tax=Terrimonas alba TaxID=3349636 RepID=UPI0035F3DD75